MSKVLELLEFVQHQGSLTVDRTAGTIRGVRVLGLESANSRRYLREAVSKARGLYEGRAVNCDHPARGSNAVPIASRFGWLENVVQEADGGLRGDLHYLKSHPMAGPIAEAAERRPGLFGLSHNARGRGRHENGCEIIETIDAVLSVDLVADPATVKGLHESRGARVRKTISELIESLKDSRPGYSRALQEMAEAGLFGQGAEMAEPDPVEAPVEMADHKQALKDACKAIIDDDALSPQDKIKKIKKVLGLINGGEPDSDKKADDADDDGETKESLRLQVKVRDLCSDRGIKPDKILRKALDACTSEAEATELLESYQPPARGQKPQSAAPWTGAVAGASGSLRESKEEAELTEEARKKRLANLRSGR